MSNTQAFTRPVAGEFEKRPFLVIWETTRACDLACKHCRAEAIARRDPRELTTAEGFELMDRVAAMGTPILILSGGDPLQRTDLAELVAYGKRCGLRIGTIPAATPRLTRERVAELAAADLDQIAFSLDGPTPETHDGFRGIPGAFARTLEGVGFARDAGIPLQINTVLAAWNFEHLDAMIELVSSLGVVFWEVFFLVPTGRGRGVECLSAVDMERAFAKLHRLSLEVPFIIKVTEAPHYRRYVVERETVHDKPRDGDEERLRHLLARPRGIRGSIGMAPQAVNSGKGFLFVDHVGEIYPSGFLPIRAGNVRQDDVATVYRESALFRELRDPTLLEGKCGLCEYAAMCSGSRARAYAMTGNYLATEPFCAYHPRNTRLLGDAAVPAGV